MLALIVEILKLLKSADCRFAVILGGALKDFFFGSEPQKSVFFGPGGDILGF